MGDKSYQRTEIQSELNAVIDAKLADMEIPVDTQDVEHARRTMRALIRKAVQIGVAHGCDPNTWMSLAADCYQKELGLDKVGSVEEVHAILASKLKAKGQSN